MADALNLDSAALSRFRAGEVPIFRHTKKAIIDLRSQGDSLSAKALARVLLADPLATLRIVHQANNRSSSRLGGDISTVEHALIMQGVGPFMNKAGALPVLEDILGGPPGKLLETLFDALRAAQHAAWQARDFAVLNSDTRAEEMEVAAMLGYAPEILAWLLDQTVARQWTKARRTHGGKAVDAETVEPALTDARLSLARAWKLPDSLCDLLDPSLADRTRQRILRASMRLADLSRTGWWHDALTTAYAELSDIVGVPAEEVAAIAHVNAIRCARHGGWIPVAPAAAWLPMEPGDWPPELDDAPVDVGPEQATDKRLDQAPSKLAPRGPNPAEPPPRTPPAEAPVCALPDQQVFRESLRNIESHLDGSLSLNQMSAQILRGLHTGLGLSRIVFAMVTPDGKRVKTRFSLGVPAGDPLRHFEFELAGKGLFCQLMSKSQGVWMKTDNRDKLWPMVGESLRAMIGEADFYAMSLFSGNRPIGMIYADRGHGGCALDAHTYTDFKMFCLQAARGLSKLKT